MRNAGLVLLIASGTALASPEDAGPPNSPFRTGANHHIGDDSFLSKFGRAPVDGRDDEKARMRAHFEYIHAALSKKPATKPALEAKRQQLLGYLAEYTRKGITPRNWRVPWRTPVFIDEAGTICAVGYLIARSEGRQLSEKIATTHRYDYLDDIAKDMPEVQRWVEASGFTLDELASIQPGYSEPEANTWQRWFASSIPDGEYTPGNEETPSRGMFAGHKMQGSWRALEVVDRKEDQGEPSREPRVVGEGEMKNGNGAWTSYYPDGTKLAVGAYVANDPSGTWRFYHHSGNLAAIGRFSAGSRVGRWKFFHDTTAQTPIAIGSFDSGGSVTGRWSHFGADGKLIATSHTETPDQFKMYPSGPNNGEGQVLDIVPGADGIRHSISMITIDGGAHRLDTYALGGERIYVQSMESSNGEIVYDATGHQLTKDEVNDEYEAADCKWGKKRKQIAAGGDVVVMHGLLFREQHQRDGEKPVCGKPTAIGEARNKRIAALLASRDLVRAQSPQFVRDLVLDSTDENKSADMIQLIAKTMTWYVEWPHIDGKFAEVFRTLPGHVVRHWYDKMMSDDGSTAQN